MIRNKYLFYILSFTWGIAMSIIGCMAAVGLIIIGCKPKMFGYCWHFEFGDCWGGLSLGPVIITSKNSSQQTKEHEHGHSLQSCKLGPFMIIISLMSVCRYWYRELKYHRNGLTPPTEYDDAWYEGNASKIGTDFINWYKTIQND